MDSRNEKQIKRHKFPYIHLPKTGFIEKTIHINGYYIHYLEQGWGETVLLISGGIGGVFLWRETMHFLSRRNFHVIAVSRIGTDKSEKPHKGFDYTAREESVILNKLREKLKINSLRVIGLSRGGSIAFTFASLFNDKVEKLILIEPIIIPFDKFPLPLKLVYISLFIPLFGDLITYLASRSIYKLFPKEIVDGVLDKLPKTQFRLNSRIIARKILYNSFMENLEQFGYGIKCPVFIMLGAKSQFRQHMKNQLVRLQDIIKNLTYDTFKDAPHAIPFFVQRVFFVSIEKFLLSGRYCLLK